MVDDRHLPWELGDTPGGSFDNGLIFTDDAIFAELDHWDWDVQQQTITSPVTAGGAVLPASGDDQDASSDFLAFIDEGSGRIQRTDRGFATLADQHNEQSANINHHQMTPPTGANPHIPASLPQPISGEMLASLPLRQPLPVATASFEDVPDCAYAFHRSDATTGSDIDDQWVASAGQNSPTLWNGEQVFQPSVTCPDQAPPNAFARMLSDENYALRTSETTNGGRSETIASSASVVSTVENGNTPKTMQSLAHAHLSPLWPEHSAAQDIRWQASTRIRPLTSRPTTPNRQLSELHRDDWQPSAQDLRHQTLTQGAAAGHTPFRINSPGNTPSHGIPIAGTSHLHQNPIVCKLKASLMQHHQQQDEMHIAPDNTYEITHNPATDPNTNTDSRKWQPQNLQSNQIASQPVTPERQRYEWAEFKEPPEDLTSETLKPLFEASGKPTFRAHDTPPDVEDNAKQNSEKAQAMGFLEEEAAEPKQGDADVISIATPVPPSRSSSHTFLGTPIRSDIVMQETNWGEHVLTPTMNREISSHSRSRSASPKKNTTPVLNGATASYVSRTRNPTQGSMPVFEEAESRPDQRVTLGQRVERAIDYADNVKKAGRLYTPAPEPATPLQKRTLEVNALTTEALKDILRGLGERVSGPKRELVRRILHQEIKEGIIKVDTVAAAERSPSFLKQLQAAAQAPHGESQAGLPAPSQHIEAEPRTGYVGSQCRADGATMPLLIPQTESGGSTDSLATDTKSTAQREHLARRVIAEPRMATWIPPNESPPSRRGSPADSSGTKSKAESMKGYLDGIAAFVARFAGPGKSSEFKASETTQERNEQIADQPCQQEASEPNAETSADIRNEQNDATMDGGEKTSTPGPSKLTEQEPCMKSADSVEQDEEESNDEPTVNNVVTDNLQPATLSATPALGSVTAIATPSTKAAKTTTSNKRKRTLKSLDKNFKLSHAGEESEDEEGAQRSAKQQKQNHKRTKKKAKAAPFRSAGNTPTTRAKTASAASKRGSLEKELLALQLTESPSEKDQGRSLRSKADRRTSH